MAGFQLNEEKTHKMLAEVMFLALSNEHCVKENVLPPKEANYSSSPPPLSVCLSPSSPALQIINFDPANELTQIAKL